MNDKLPTQIQEEIEIGNSPVLEVHKTILRLDDLLEELKGLRKMLYPGLWFIRAKVKSAKANSIWGKSPSFQDLFCQWSHLRPA